MSETEVRRRVLGYVKRYQGIHARELERQLGLSNKLASYHLGVLEARGKVHRTEEDRFTRFWTTRTFAGLSSKDIPFLSLMRRGPALKITVALLSAKAVTPHELGAPLGVAKASISYHLSVLTGVGLLKMEAKGRNRWYSLTNPRYVRSMLSEFHPTPGELDRFSSMWNDLFR